MADQPTTPTPVAPEKKITVTPAPPDPVLQKLIDAQRAEYQKDPIAYKQRHGGYNVGGTDPLAEANLRQRESVKQQRDAQDAATLAERTRLAQQIQATLRQKGNVEFFKTDTGLQVQMTTPIQQEQTLKIPKALSESIRKDVSENTSLSPTTTANIPLAQNIFSPPIEKDRKVISAATPLTNAQPQQTFQEFVDIKAFNTAENLISKIPLAQGSIAANFVAASIEREAGIISGVLKAPMDIYETVIKVPSALSKSSTAQAMLANSQNPITVPTAVVKDVAKGGNALITGIVSIPLDIVKAEATGNQFGSGEIIGNVGVQYLVGEAFLPIKEKPSAKTVSLIDEATKTRTADVIKAEPGVTFGAKLPGGEIAFKSQEKVRVKSDTPISKEDITLLGNDAVARSVTLPGYEGTILADTKGIITGEEMVARQSAKAKVKGFAEEVVVVGKVEPVSPEYLKAQRFNEQFAEDYSKAHEIMLKEIAEGRRPLADAASIQRNPLDFVSPIQKQVIKEPSFAPQYIFQDNPTILERTTKVESSTVAPSIEIRKTGADILTVGDIISKSKQKTPQASIGLVAVVPTAEGLIPYGSRPTFISKEILDQVKAPSVSKSLLTGEYKVVKKGEGITSSFDVESNGEAITSKVTEYPNEKPTVIGSAMQSPIDSAFKPVQEVASKTEVSKVFQSESAKFIKSGSQLTGTLKTKFTEQPTAVTIIEPEFAQQAVKESAIRKAPINMRVETGYTEPLQLTAVGREPIIVDVGVADIGTPIKKAAVDVQVGGGGTVSGLNFGQQASVLFEPLEQSTAKATGKAVLRYTEPSLLGTVKAPQVRLPDIEFVKDTALHPSASRVNVPQAGRLRPIVDTKSSSTQVRALRESHKQERATIIDNARETITTPDVTTDVVRLSKQNREISQTPKLQLRTSTSSIQIQQTSAVPFESPILPPNQPISPVTPITENIPIPSIRLPGGFARPKEQERRRSKVFSTYVKRRGRFIRIGRDLSKEKALELGAKEVRATSAATFRIQQEGFTDKQDKGSFMQNMSDFVQKRADTFIQRAAKRISSRGEKQEITFKGVAASRMRRNRIL